MKCCQSKIFVAFVTFIFGVTAFFLGDKMTLVVSNLVDVDFSVERRAEEKFVPKNLSGKLEIRFVKFEKVFRNQELPYSELFDNLAEFEVINGTNENVYYSSHCKECYPFPTRKVDGKPFNVYLGHCGTGIEEQVLVPGEIVRFSVPKQEVTFEVKKVSAKKVTLGFPFLVGTNRRAETLWSEEINFPQ